MSFICQHTKIVKHKQQSLYHKNRHNTQLLIQYAVKIAKAQNNIVKMQKPSFVKHIYRYKLNFLKKRTLQVKN